MSITLPDRVHEPPYSVEVRGLTKFYQGAPAVRNVNLSMRPGEITCLLGPSGCGKSTLLRTIAGFESVDAGEIFLLGRCVARHGFSERPDRRGVGLVFQDAALFPHLSVLDNILFGLKELPKADRAPRALNVLHQVGLAHRAGAWPHHLSGGEQQRIAVARALAPSPKVILLDEPFSGLDGPLKAEVRDICISQLRASGVATLLVTHDPLEALQVADRLALMSDGGLLQVDTPEGCYRRPASAIAARLLGAANAVPAHLSAGVAHTPLGDFPAPHHLNGAGSVIIRPEDVQLFDHAQSGRHPARITNRRYLGAYEEFALRLGSIDLLVRAAAGESPVSTDVYVQIEANKVWSCAV